MLGTPKSRPVYRNLNLFSDLPSYRLPPAGIVSILHRVSGAALFLTLPFLLYLFDRSLVSEISYVKFQNVFALWYVKVLLSGLSWAYLHHFVAGIRHLFMDMHYGLEKEPAQRSALMVFAISLPLSVLVILKIWGVF